eukprot:768583-Hanusia_phi.AAC.4
MGEEQNHGLGKSPCCCWEGMMLVSPQKEMGAYTRALLRDPAMRIKVLMRTCEVREEVRGETGGEGRKLRGGAIEEEERRRGRKETERMREAKRR